MPASTSLPNTDLFVDGAWRPAADDARFTLLNPATEEVLAEVAEASEADVDAAVRSAAGQLDGVWARMSGRERGRLLARVADLIESDVENLARLEALDVGKPYRDALNADIPNAAETFRHFAGWADKVQGSTVPVPDQWGATHFNYTRREPVGVVAAVTPWNAPTMIAAWKLGPALAAGCTVVIKPPEDAPLTTLRLAELIAEAGIPEGVVNVVTGRGATTGAALVRHPGVAKVSFTGSPETGRAIGRVAADGFKRVTLELGGKSPQIVFPDANLEAAIPVAAAAVFANQGEVCAAGTRIFVHETVRDAMIEGLRAAAAQVVVGDPFAEDTTMGALINERQLNRVLGYIESGKSDGAELLCGGSRLERRGYFVEPTLFTGHNDLTIAREEIFGPVGTIIGFTDTEDALRQANDSDYGLNAIVWTQDLTTAHRTAARLQTGRVWINGWGAPDPALPWGGVKTSGIGRELGLAGLHAHTEEKVVSVVL